MLLKDFIADAVAALRALYPEEEARSVVRSLCEELLGVKSYTHILEPGTEIPPAREAALAAAMERLKAAEPLQYVTGHASFCGFDFKVTPDVLIPRPETECLVREACAAAATMKHPIRVLDLCTGSGCVAWSVALLLPDARVTGVDISEAALAVAAGQDLSGQVRQAGGQAPSFVRCDILRDDIPFSAASFDLILANPPYVMESQKAAMRRNVLDYEPSLALFVPDADPLVFYRAVARWARHCLAPEGRGFVEINEDLGPDTRSLFLQNDFDKSVILDDYLGKNRIVAF